MYSELFFPLLLDEVITKSGRTALKRSKKLRNQGKYRGDDLILELTKKIT